MSMRHNKIIRVPRVYRTFLRCIMVSVKEILNNDITPGKTFYVNFSSRVHSLNLMYTYACVVFFFFKFDWNVFIGFRKITTLRTFFFFIASQRLSAKVENEFYIGVLHWSSNRLGIIYRPFSKLYFQCAYTFRKRKRLIFKRQPKFFPTLSYTTKINKRKRFFDFQFRYVNNHHVKSWSCESLFA